MTAAIRTYLALIFFAGAAMAEPVTPAPDDLGATDYIDTSDPDIAATARRVTAGLASPRDKAVAIFNFVRDEIAFGFARGFYDQRASDVLARGVGFCNTKSTLFAALLRHAGIPARQIFVDIDATILYGVLDPGTAYVDHSYVEVFLDGVWIATDAYIVDPRLFRAAKARLTAEGRLLGYGVHAHGSNTWDGRGPSFSQFADAGAATLSTKAARHYRDVGDFYARDPAPWNKTGWALRQAFGLIASGANDRIDEIRRETMPAVR